jgi:hypothetical protein
MMGGGAEGSALVVAGEHCVRERGREVVRVEPPRLVEVEVNVDVSFAVGLRSSAEKSIGLTGESGTEGWWLQRRMLQDVQLRDSLMARLVKSADGSVTGLMADGVTEGWWLHRRMLHEVDLRGSIGALRLTPVVGCAPKSMTEEYTAGPAEEREVHSSRAVFSD